MKIKCSHVGNRHSWRAVKTRAIISDSDFKPLGTTEASACKRPAAAAKMSESDFEPVVTAKAPARKRSAAAAKPRKRVRKPVRVVPESSSEEEDVPKKNRNAKDVQEVLGVVQGMSIFHT